MSQSLAKVQPTQIARSAMQDKLEYCQQMAKGNLLPKQYFQNPGNLLIAIEYGEALSLPTIVAIQQVHIIEGKVSASSALISSLVRRAGHKLRVDGDSKAATCKITRCDDTEPYVVTFTIEDARTAGLTGKDVWKKYPREMLKARAITACARDACQEALNGLCYTPEELGATVSVDGEPVVVSQATVPDVQQDNVIEAEVVARTDQQAEHANILTSNIIGKRAERNGHWWTMLARVQKLARTVFGTEDKWSEFLGNRDLATMALDDLRAFGSELQQMQAKKRPAPKPEIAEADVVDLDQHHAEKSTGRRETLQKKFWATVRERLVMAGSYVGNDVVYWWLEKSGFGPYDEDLGRIRVSQMHADDLGKACEYVASLFPADLVRAYTAEMEGR